SDKVWPLGRDCKRLSGRQSNVLLRVLQKDADRPRHHIKRIVHVCVIMPRHFLCRADLQLRNTKTRARRMVGAAVNFIQPACILHTLHVVSFKRPHSCTEATGARAPRNPMVGSRPVAAPAPPAATPPRPVLSYLAECDSIENKYNSHQRTKHPC